MAPWNEESRTVLPMHVGIFAGSAKPSCSGRYISIVISRNASLASDSTQIQPFVNNAVGTTKFESSEFCVLRTLAP